MLKEDSKNLQVARRRRLRKHTTWRMLFRVPCDMQPCAKYCVFLGRVFDWVPDKGKVGRILGFQSIRSGNLLYTYQDFYGEETDKL